MLNQLGDFNVQKSNSQANSYIAEITNPSFCRYLPYNQNIVRHLAVTSEWLETKRITISFHDIMAPSANKLTVSCPDAYEAEVEYLAVI